MSSNNEFFEFSFTFKRKSKQSCVVLGTKTRIPKTGSENDDLAATITVHRQNRDRIMSRYFFFCIASISLL